MMNRSLAYWGFSWCCIAAVACGGAADDDSASRDASGGNSAVSGGSNNAGSNNDRASGGRSVDEERQSGGGGTTGGGALEGAGGGHLTGTGGQGMVSLWPVPLPLSLGAEGLPIEDVPLSQDETSCLPPCAFSLQPSDMIPDGMIGARLWIDFSTPAAVLRPPSSMSSESEEAVMLFTYEDNQYGFGVWSSAPFTWVLAQNFVYSDDAMLSMAEDELMRAQMTNYQTGSIALVVFSFGQGIVRIHSVRVPNCSAESEQACSNESDCPFVDIGNVESLSSECNSCYQQAKDCSVEHCSSTCPGQGGNACLNCERDNGCADAFMECSGLDYVPLNVLTLPRAM